MRRTTALALSILLISPAAHGATGYINDEFEITMRSGESTRHSIVRMLASGTRIEVIEENGETGYTKVRTGQGAEGYVLTRFISDQPVARDRLARALERLESLQTEKAALDEQVAELRNEKTQLETERSDLRSRNGNLSADLTDIRQTSANVLAIDRENKELNARLSESESTIASLKAQNESLVSNSSQRWFILGAGAVLLGALLGYVLPRIQWRRRSRWGDL